MDISSKHNPRFKSLIELQTKRGREEAGLFLIEGYREILRAHEASWPIQALYFCPPLFLGENEETLLHKMKEKGIPIFHLTEPLFRKVAYRERPEGLMAVGTIVNRPLESLAWKTSSPPLFLIAEAIEKPGNLGTMLRSADAAGATGMIIADPCTDIYNPNVVRASVGTLFSVPVVQSTSPEILVWLREKEIRSCAASPSAASSFTNTDLTGPLAVVVGTEQLGLSDLWMRATDLQVSIPMLGIADSLNVATAATLILYEAQRQRHSLRG